MNSGSFTPLNNGSTLHRVEFFCLLAQGKRDPFFGLSRGWYYKAANAGEIKMVAVRQRGAMRGVRLVVYDSVADYIRRAAWSATAPRSPASTASQLPIACEEA